MTLASLREMIVAKIKIDEMHDEQFLFLREKQGIRVLPLVVGIAEINAIRMKLGNIAMPRPMTHDLMSAMIDSLDARVERVVVDRLENNTYYAKIVMRKRTAKKDIIIDARPSDSIALALRSNAPIFVENAVLDAAGMSASGGVSP